MKEILSLRVAAFWTSTIGLHYLMCSYAVICTLQIGSYRIRTQKMPEVNIICHSWFRVTNLNFSEKSLKIKRKGTSFNDEGRSFVWMVYFLYITCYFEKAWRREISWGISLSFYQFKNLYVDSVRYLDLVVTNLAYLFVGMWRTLVEKIL